MDQSLERRKYMEQLFIDNKVKNCRVPGISIPENKNFGCIASHIKAIRTFYESGEEVGIICEDDLSFEYKPFWKNSLNEIISKGPIDWEIIQLAINVSEETLNKCFYNGKLNYIPDPLNNFIACCGCYAINRRGAEKIIDLDLARLVNSVAEYVLYFYARTYTYKYPPFTYRDNNDSTIHPQYLWEHVRAKGLVTKYIIDKY
ncbi:MAG: putative family 25 glycosyltransferase [Barrevirus sp.]|uniref:Putative family 25 glycosyltransferase n=1 Tax=Barrevirus sp. TaxID=2487763 RepID=A0A3G4ZT51_9VIRU|nr:MAG: putative family 25 glycosyltransferase [Barrevirus sp.]